MLLKIGELAKQAGLTVRTLHHYDHIGLLSPSARSAGGYRLYNRADVERLHRIQALKQFGCSLAEIKAFLAAPGASIDAILSQQMRDLETQVRRARALRDRLARLRQRLARGETAGLTDWLAVLKMMTLYERHLSGRELDALFAQKRAGTLEEECSRIVARARGAMTRGVPPEGEEAQQLAWCWVRLWREATGNDAVLAQKLWRLHREEQTPLSQGLTPEIGGYLIRSFAQARATLLGRYLSPAELEGVRTRQAAHLFEWPPLIAEAQQQIQHGAAPGDPSVQHLARRWEELFRASYAGEDRRLAEKIRLAFKKEPDLLVGIGIDHSLLAFMERARMEFSGSQSGGGRPAGAPKPTALRVATLRAVHQLLDNPPVFVDPLALPILGAAEAEGLRRDPAPYDTPLLRGLRTSVAVRSRLAEEEWAQARRRGVRQYVILGAGLDTCAYRQESGAGERIFEVDLPATQAWKRQRLRAAGLAEPSWLTYVPIDFEGEALAVVLARAGFDRQQPAFFSWLGVTMYLAEAAILATLGFIASLPPGSGVVFDYAVSPAFLAPREQKALAALSARAAAGGEPWKTYFAPGELAARLTTLGFTAVEELGPQQLNARYLDGRSDGLRKSGVSHLLCARV